MRRGKHRNDYNHGKDGRIGGNPRYAQIKSLNSRDERPHKNRSKRNMTLFKNNNCDNDKCVDPNSEVRLLPTGGDGNMIVCQACYEHEMSFRRQQNAGSTHKLYHTPKWEDLTIYDGSK